MLSFLLEATPQYVDVLDHEGNRVRVSIRLTPMRRYLTQRTKRMLIATGFMLRYGRDAARDPILLDGALAEIRRAVLASLARETFDGQCD